MDPTATIYLASLRHIGSKLRFTSISIVEDEHYRIKESNVEETRV